MTQFSQANIILNGKCLAFYFKQSVLLKIFQDTNDIFR